MLQTCKRDLDNVHIADCNHANGLPDTKANTGSHTTVKTLDTVVAVNVLEGVADRHLLGSVRVLLLALHLDTDDLNGLVPGTETTTKTRGKNLLSSRELLARLLAGGTADPALSQTAKTETATPVGHLADSNSVDTLVNTADTILAVDVHEGGKGGGRLNTGGSHLVLGDLDRLHAGAETHGSVSLGNTTSDTTEDAATKVGGTSATSVEFGLGCDEEENGALGGGFDPGPGDEALVD